MLRKNRSPGRKFRNALQALRQLFLRIPDLQGAFPLPARFPVQGRGTHVDAGQTPDILFGRPADLKTPTEVTCALRQDNEEIDIPFTKPTWYKTGA